MSEKTKKKKSNFYFGQEEEQALVDYINATDQKTKDEIFRTKLYYPFSKMVESIIRRYILFTPGEDFEDTFFEGMSYLITKIDKFDVTKNKKAYSYFGTIIKRHLIGKRKKQQNKMQKHISYEMLFPNTESDTRAEDNYNIDNKQFHSDLINNTISALQEALLPKNTVFYKKNEIKIGNALLEMMMHWEDIFTYMGSRKFGKACVLQFLRDYTDLTTKEIRVGMKRYRHLFAETMEDLILNG